MKYLIALITIAIVLPATAENVPHPYSGNTWQITMSRDGGPAIKPYCVTFQSGGKLIMSDLNTTMLWKTHPSSSRIFLAVTDPSTDSVAPFQRAVHGYVAENGTIRASGIDQYGSAFVFVGERAKECRQLPVTGSETSPSETRPLEPDNRGVDLGDLTNQVNDQSDNALVRNKIIDRLFQFTVSNGKDETRQYCWYFGQNRSMDTSDGSIVVWTPDSLLTYASHGFKAVGVDANGSGIGFQGALVSDSILYVHGIESKNGNATALFGNGKVVDTCEPTGQE